MIPASIFASCQGITSVKALCAALSNGCTSDGSISYLPDFNLTSLSTWAQPAISFKFILFPRPNGNLLNIFSNPGAPRFDIEPSLRFIAPGKPSSLEFNNFAP